MIAKVLCPNLRLGVANGLLNPDEDGWVLEQELRYFLTIIGVAESTILQELLISTAVNAVEEKHEGYVNIFKLKDTFLDHGSSSGIYQDVFDDSKLSFLKTFMVNGKLDSKGLAKVCSYYHKCPVKKLSNLGTNIYSFEMENFLNVYGRTDESGSYCSSISRLYLLL